MREILLAYQTLIDPERRRTYELSRSRHMPGSFVPAEKNTDVSPTAPHARQRSYAFPVLNEGAPVQIDLGEITYLLSPREVRRLKEQGMLRGARAPSIAETYYCHRCQHQWQAALLPAFCPQCQARDWREYPVLRCQHCHAVFVSEQFVTRLVRCTMVTACSARPTNCSPCAPTVAELSGLPPRKRAYGTCETRRREWQNGGGDSDLSDSSNLVVTHNEGCVRTETCAGSLGHPSEELVVFLQLNAPRSQHSHFQAGIILLCVGEYLGFRPGYRDLEEIMLERGLHVDHTTTYRSSPTACSRTGPPVQTAFHGDDGPLAR